MDVAKMFFRIFLKVVIVIGSSNTRTVNPIFLIFIVKCVHKNRSLHPVTYYKFSSCFDSFSSKLWKFLPYLRRNWRRSCLMYHKITYLKFWYSEVLLHFCPHLYLAPISFSLSISSLSIYLISILISLLTYFCVQWGTLSYLFSPFLTANC